MGDQEKKNEPFRFIGDAEFQALDSKTRMAYLNRAQAALLDERERLSMFMREHAKKQKEGG